MRKRLLEVRGKRFLSSNSDPCYVVVANFVLLPMITWKVKNAANELDDIAKRFPDRILNALLLFDTFSKM